MEMAIEASVYAIEVSQLSAVSSLIERALTETNWRRIIVLGVCEGGLNSRQLVVEILEDEVVPASCHEQQSGSVVLQVDREALGLSCVRPANAHLRKAIEEGGCQGTPHRESSAETEGVVAVPANVLEDF